MKVEEVLHSVGVETANTDPVVEEDLDVEVEFNC